MVLGGRFAAAGEVPNPLIATAVQSFTLAAALRAAYKAWKKSEVENGREVNLLSRLEAEEKMGSWAVEGKADILGFYRRPCSFWGCACSCGSVHNETANVWTHRGCRHWTIL